MWREQLLLKCREQYWEHTVREGSSYCWSVGSSTRNTLYVEGAATAGL